MKSSDYWKGRFEYLEGQKAKRGAEYFNNLESQYDIAIRDIERDISAWYSRFATENEISFQEAKRLLNSRELAAFRMDVKEYIEKGQSLDPQWRKALEQASAKVHVSRLEALKVQLQQRAEWVSASQRDTLDDLARKVYSEQYYRTAFEFQKGVGIGWEFARLDTKKIDNYIVKPWAADGKNFSKRIWESRDKLVGELNTRLTQSIIRGLPPDKVIKEISGRFNVSKKAAGRLIMTESAFFATVAQKDALKELDVEKYEILATLDSKTSETCRHMDGQVFKLSEHRPGETAPPFHVYCRTTTVPYFDDKMPGERAARDNEGKYYTIPENIKYQDWEDKFVNGGDKGGLSEIVPDVKTFDAVKKILKEKNVDIWEDTLEGVDKEFLTENLYKLNDLIEEYPKVGEYIKNNSFVFSGTNSNDGTLAFAHINLEGRIGIAISKKDHSSLQGVIDTVMENVKSGFFMPIKEEYAKHYTLTHEFGHIIEYVMTEDYKKIESEWWNEILSKKDKGRLPAFYESFEEKFYGKFLDKANEKDIMSFQLKKSKYGKTSHAEFFAEAFVNSKGGEVVNSGEIMNEILEGEFK